MPLSEKAQQARKALVKVFGKILIEDGEKGFTGQLPSAWLAKKNDPCNLSGGIHGITGMIVDDIYIRLFNRVAEIAQQEDKLVYAINEGTPDLKVVGVRDNEFESVDCSDTQLTLTARWQ